MPDARGQFAADDRRPHAIPHRMARVLRFCQTPRVLTNLEAWIRRRMRLYLWRQWRNGHNRFTELRRLGIAKFAASVAAGSPTGSGACPDTRRFNTLYEIRCSTLLVSPNLHACAGLTRSNRRGTDPYARWCGRGGVARRPPIPICNLYYADFQIMPTSVGERAFVAVTAAYNVGIIQSSWYKSDR